MKSLSTILLYIFISLQSFAAEPVNYKIASRVIILPKDFPISIKPGIYTDGQIEVFFRVMNQPKFIRLNTTPSIVSKLDTPVDLDLSYTVLKLNLKGITMKQGEGAITLTGSYIFTKPERTIKLNDNLPLNHSLIKISGNTAIILKLTSAK